jgi:pilus assembly protein CpaE
LSAKVLIVDDEPNLLRLIEYSLEVEGYEIVTALNGAEALEQIRTEQPALLILDIMLPDMSGLDVCRQLRGEPETIDLPIIMLSARAQVRDKVKGLEAGADEYVTKPVEPDEIVARVGALLERTRRLRQAQPVKRGKVLGFIGAKGGVGTTTVALNIALALIKRQKTVIAMELRSYFGTFAHQLGLMPATGLVDLLPLQPRRIDERELRKTLTDHATGLKVLCGPKKAQESGPIEPELAEAVVEGLAGMADYLVIDLPCHPSPASRAALRRCDSVVMVAEPESTCVASGEATLARLSAWGVIGDSVRVAVVKVAESGHAMSLTEIRSQLGCEIVGVMTAAPDLSRTALNLGVPVMISQPKSMVAISLSQMADRLAADQIMTLPA